MIDTAALLDLTLPDLAATQRLARALAGRARRGDVIALWGTLGVGKTTFARDFIHARAGGNDAGEVPSPTFTLVQVYDLPDALVWHFDLYRLTQPEDAWELGLEEALAEAISLIEWPERLGDLLPPDRLDLELIMSDGPETRRARLTGHGEWRRRLEELKRDV